MTDLTKDEREAFKAFKKKLKSTQLDDDSKLGHGPMSGGGQGRVVAITPPAGHGREIWNELVRKGILVHDGSLYALAPGQH
jgi:hypothetical protein